MHALSSTANTHPYCNFPAPPQPACVRGDTAQPQHSPSTTLNGAFDRGKQRTASGQLDLNALLSSLHKEQQGKLGGNVRHAQIFFSSRRPCVPLSAVCKTMPQHLAHWPPILVVQTARFHATTDAEPDCHSSDKAVSKGAKQQASLLGTFDPPSYVSMVCRLQDMAAPAGGDRKHSKHIAKLEAMRRRQGSGRVNMHEHTHMLTLSYANPALIEVLGGAEKVSHWVDVHISQNPLLLWQLSRHM
eukprot:305690-Pelagomonas_calceolata.AAC.8